jgi:hypothetical protein
MKRWLILIAAVGALALILAGSALLGGHSRSTTAAGPFTVAVSSFPGNPPSGVTGSVTYMDIGAGVAGGFAIANWTPPPNYSNMAVFFYSGNNCLPQQRVAALVWHPGLGDQNIFLTNGVQLGALDGSTILINEVTHLPYAGGAASILSVGMATLPNYPAVDFPNVQYVACGNIPPAAVTGWEGLLDTDETFIHPPAWLTAFEIDKVKDDVLPVGHPDGVPDSWCQPVDNEADVVVGDTEQVAICLSNAAQSPAAFNFDLVYNDLLNACSPDINCTVGTCMDDNPDANGDASLGGGATFWTTPDLGAGYDCGKGAFQPLCDKDTDTGPGQGRAYMSCTTTDVPTLPVGAGVSSPLAVISFTALYVGVDTLKLENTAAFAANGAEIASCYTGTLPYPCFNATDTKLGDPVPPTSTPTVTPTATATRTCGNPGQPACPASTPTPKAWTKTPTPPATGTPAPAEEPSSPPPPPPPPPPTGGQLPQVVPPGTGSGPADGVPWLNTLIWLVAGAGAVSVALSGLYVRYARHR